MKKLLFLLSLLPALVSGQGKIYIRTTEGVAPYTYQLFNASGTLVETRQSSKAEEQFNAPGYGYSWKVTGADNSSNTGSVDGVSHQLMNIPCKMKGGHYGGAEEFYNGFNTLRQLNPFYNAYNITFHAFDHLNTPAKWNSSFWQGEEYDHTIANQSFTTDQKNNTFDQVVNAAYLSGNSLSTRTTLRLIFDGGLISTQLGSFGYSESELPKTPDGQIWDQRPSGGYLTRFPSYASTTALNFYKEGLLKFCRRYRRAINDGTIREIVFQLNESGESNMSGGYYAADGTYSYNMGDYSELMRQKFINFCIARFGSIQVMNQKLGTSIPNFQLSSFGANMLLNGADGGNTKMRSFWQWFQMEMHDLFEFEMQKYLYDNLSISRTRLFSYDVGSIMNGDFFRMKSYNYAQRLLKNDKWMAVKTNNSPEFSAGPFVADQVTSAAQIAGAQPQWEPSPAYPAFTVEVQTYAFNVAKAAGLGFSSYSAPANYIPENIDSYEFWNRVNNNADMAGYMANFKVNNLDASGNLITLTVPFFDVALEGMYDHIGDNKINGLWQNKRQANPGKNIFIRVDDSDLRSLFVNPYPLNTQATVSNP